MHSKDHNHDIFRSSAVGLYAKIVNDTKIDTNTYIHTYEYFTGTINL